MDKYKLFLQQSNIESSVLKNSQLERVSVYETQNRWVFHISIDEIVPISDFEPFIEQLKMTFQVPGYVDKIKVITRFKKTDSFAKFADDYWKYVMRLIAKKYPTYIVLNNYEVNYQDGVYNLVVDVESEKIVRKYLKKFEEVFESFGIDIKMKLQVSDDKLTIKSEIKDLQKQSEEVMSQVDYTKREPNRQIKTNGVAKFSSVKISEIPLDKRTMDLYVNEKGAPYFEIKGVVFKHEVRYFEKATILIMTVADQRDAIIVKQFVRGKAIDKAEALMLGDLVTVRGHIEVDTFLKDIVFWVKESGESIEITGKKEPKIREDNAKKKRIEFHVHTKMSNMDAICDAKEYLEQAVDWGHEAIAFTDHNGLYAFPEIHNSSRKLPIKPIYGAELDFVDEAGFLITTPGPDSELANATYVVFDVETTGLSATRDKIIEIGAVKVKEGQIIDRYQSFVNPEEPLKPFTTQLTGITDEMVMQAPLIEQALPEFLKFVGDKDTILIAHNALFDVGFISANTKKLGIKRSENRVVDTLNLARYFYSNELKRFNLKAVARYFKVKLEEHHRADHDAEATANVWISMMQELIEKKITTYQAINESIDINEGYKHTRPHHINVLVANQKGYKNLFKVVSKSLTDNFYGGPRTLKKDVVEHREGLLIGSGCSNGDVFEAALNKTDEELTKAILFYDYIEVQPVGAYQHIIENIGLDGAEEIKKVIKKIVAFAKQNKKIVIASSDAHYLNKEDKMYRDIYIRAPLVGGGIHPLRNLESPDQYLLTTDEMLNEFSYLGELEAHELVVENTHKLNNLIEKVEAFSNKLYSLPDDTFKDNLKVASIATEVESLVSESAAKRYGKKPHPIIQARLDLELKSIIGNEFAPIYYISYLLVKKSLEDGYLVGSRGSVGSSLVATLMNITEVNPLVPHYYCEKGHFVALKMTAQEVEKYGLTDDERKVFPNFKEAQSGFDLPDCDCPKCGVKLTKDGHDIPFETFLGFDGDKVPDIDLNFSGDYQAKAHEYVRELLGKDKTFRAGTIQTVAERNAFGYVKGYVEDQQIEMRAAQVERLASKIQGVKRSTGQHPGGIVVVPPDKDIYDVTPIQYPADDVSSPWFTTHFDYHSFEDNLLKLDILGHDDPTLIKYLMDYVDQNSGEFPFTKAKDIPLDDPKVYQLFAGTSIIGLSPHDINSQIASYGIPEFGTPFTRQMLQDTKPDTFAGLVKVSGLSHGTDVWLKNAQVLISGETDFGKISFDDIIACRDDIMVQLVQQGIEPLMAFTIMEFVRRGNPSRDGATWEKYEKIMRDQGVPEWYIWSATQIKYMFPKAHATAYVIMAMRIAWFKIYKPLLFYSGFFTKRATQFDHEIMVSGSNAIRNKITSFGDNHYRLKPKEENLLVTLGVALEMTKRGYKFLPVNVQKSDSFSFLMEEKGLRMPFNSIDGLGNMVAIDIVEKRVEKPFSSKEDVRKRTRINKTVFDIMLLAGSFDDLPDEDELLEQGIFAL